MPQFRIPQGDSNSSRAAELALVRADYGYNFEFGIPIGEKFYDRDKASLTWTIKVLRLLYKLRSNVEAVVEKTGYSFKEPIPQKSVFALAKNLAEKDLKALFLYYNPDLGPINPSGRPRDIKDYRGFFQKLALPEVAEDFETDAAFNYSFVAGANPLLIQKMTRALEKFPLSDDVIRRHPAFRNDSLENLRNSGRLYYVDFQELSSLVNGEHPQQKKYIYHPLIALARPANGTGLEAIAIQLGQTPSEVGLYTPDKSYDWKIAKSIVAAATYTYHELLSHLGFTHLMIEPIVLSTRRNLHATHPIYALLSPHFEGTMPINFLAVTKLIQPGEAVDRLVGSHKDSNYALIAKQRLAYSFKGNFVPSRLERMGTASTSELPLYPYRDDALPIWNALRTWTANYVDFYYPNESSLRADTELQAWAAEISSDKGGMIKDFASNGGVSSKNELIDTLTMTIFTAGPQHAAVNFSQRSHMSFVPAAPLSGYIDLPTAKGASREDWLNFFPPLDVALRQAQISNFLGGIYHSNLGNYGSSYFKDPVIKTAQTLLLKQFENQELNVTLANKTRPKPYVHLLPSKIPQSINI